MHRRVLPCLLAVAAARVALAQAPTPPPSAPSIAGWDLDGTFIDPRDKLDAFVAALTPQGTPFIESGDADRVGAVLIGTLPRLERAFEAIGYEAHATAAATGGAIRLRVTLAPLSRVRQIFVRGNWPLRQDEIQRRISIRLGQPLPPAGKRRDELLATERQRIVEFLQAEGYRDAQVTVELVPRPGTPPPMFLVIRMKLGDDYPLGKIDVKGNDALPTSAFEEQLRHRKWYKPWEPLPFKSALLREDLAELTTRYRGLGYPGARILDHVQLERGQRRVDLALDVKERRKVEIVFEGNACCSDARLRDDVTFFQRGGYDEYEVSASEESIASGYHERGYMFVRVGHRTEHVSPQLDRVTYIIDEGPRLRVRSVSFAGAGAFGPDQLDAVVSVKVFPLLGYIGLGSGGYASVRQLLLDAENLAEHYHQQGFPDARVRVEIAPNDQVFAPLDLVVRTAGGDARWRRASALHVRFVVEEGRRITVRRIAFQPAANERLPRDEAFLKASLLTLEGQPLREGPLREDEGRLRRLLGDEGYPYARVEHALSYAGDDATVTWNVELGPRVRVGPVFVRGNFLTRESTVLRWIPLQPGDYLTTTAIERGERNLALLQLFNNASPISFPGEEQRREIVPMLVQVEERHDHLGVFHVGGGISTEQYTPGSNIPIGAYASAGYEHRNLLGLGWTLLSTLTYGNSVTRAQASLLDPRLFGTLFRLELAASYLQQLTARFGDLRSGAFSVTVRREMLPGLTGFVAYSLRDTFRTEFLIRPQGPDARQSTVRLGTLVGSATVGLDLLRLDNLLIPTRGFKLHGDVEYAAPAFTFGAGADAFLNLHTRSLVVVPVTRSLTVRQSVRFEQGFPLRGATMLPAVERYFAGGDTTLRGFDLDRARTEVVRTPTVNNVDLVEFRPLGGNVRILSNFELVFPLARPVYGAVFLDSGVVADSLDGLALRTFRHAVGVTPLLVRLPVGDLSLSWAWPLDPGPGDARIGRLHFNVGLMF